MVALKGSIRQVVRSLQNVAACAYHRLNRNSTDHRSSLLRQSAALATFLVATTGGCGHTMDQAQPLPASRLQPLPAPYSSPLKRTWATEVDRLAPSNKERLEVEFDVMTRLLRSHQPSEIEAEIRRSSAQATVSDVYQRVLLGAYCELLAHAGDDAALQAILAIECPRSIGWGRTEYLLATSRLSDPIRVLAGALNDSVDPQNRVVIAAMLAASFPSIAQQFDVSELAIPRRWADAKSNAKYFAGDSANTLRLFAAACARWYRLNRPRLQVNKEYDAYDEEESILYGVRSGPLYRSSTHPSNGPG